MKSCDGGQNPEPDMSKSSYLSFGPCSGQDSMPRRVELERLDGAAVL